MVKKKSKFRSILINKKRYYFCKITWLDILGDSGHADINEFNEMKPAEMITHAYVFYNDSKVVKNIRINNHLSRFHLIKLICISVPAVT